MRSEEQYETIDQYIALHAPAVQKVLEKVRHAARKGAPEAEEVISYRMPALKQKGILIYFAGWQSHIGLYPPIRGDEELVQACALFILHIF